MFLPRPSYGPDCCNKYIIRIGITVDDIFIIQAQCRRQQFPGKAQLIFLIDPAFPGAMTFKKMLPSTCFITI